jgi:hypothetical protein
VAETIVIEERFNGPPHSGHGGYTSGILARLIDGPAEATLRAPPPLGRPLTVERRKDDSFALVDDETLVAEGRSVSEVDVEVPEPVSLGDAERASARYIGFERHIFDTCFVCGPAREDALGVFAGPVEGGGRLVASLWTPRAWTADESGRVRPEFVWSALDCPTYFALCLDGTQPLSMLGRLTAELTGPVEAGAPHVVTAWPIAKEGRKHHAGSAIFSADGRQLAVARALLIETPEQVRGAVAN